MLDELNDAIKSGGGDWLKLTEEGQQVTGVLLDAEVRDKMFKDKLVMSQKTGKPRKEWVLTLEVDGEVKYVAAAEGGQIAIRAAATKLGRNLTKGDVLAIRVTESSVPGESGAEWDVTITDGKAPAADDDAPPF